MNAEQRLAEIRSRLEAELSPESLQVDDESHLHVGHEGAKGGLGTFAYWWSQTGSRASLRLNATAWSTGPWVT